MPERPNGVVLKTTVGQLTGGSNPSPSASKAELSVLFFCLTLIAEHCILNIRNMKKIYLILLVFLVAFLIIENTTAKDERKIIAVCPVFLDLVNNLDASKFDIIKVGSASEGLEILNNGEVDYVLAGRILKPEEKANSMDFISKEGYSLLSNEEKVVYTKDLQEINIYTDMDIERIKDDFSVEKVLSVKNVYDYLDKGIVITSWDNTDYSKAKIVNLMNSDGTRSLLSVTPIVYCRNICDNYIIETLKFYYE